MGYEGGIYIINHGRIAQARLKVIRLPKSSYWDIWENRKRSASISQDRTELNGDLRHMDDVDFLERLIRDVQAEVHAVTRAL